MFKANLAEVLQWFLYKGKRHKGWWWI